MAKKKFFWPWWDSKHDSQNIIYMYFKYMYNVLVIISWLVLRSSFRPGQGTHQRPFCLANSLDIVPKVPFANKMMTAVSPYIAYKDSRQHKFTSES